MAKHKYIYWRNDLKPNEEGEAFANVHLLVGYNQASITDLRKMAEELKETFPQATDDKIYCGKVTKSSYVYGHTIITWNAYIPKGDYPDWQQFEDGRRPEYIW